jgi:uncharacterized protein
MGSRQASAERVPGTFDAFALARRGAAIAGALDASTLPRVADRLAPGRAPLRWRIAGTADGAQHPALEIAVDGTVPLECQSCLRTFQWPVAQRTLVLLARDERELARLDQADESEVIVGDAAQVARTLIEDELLLTLPFAPQCRRDDCARRTAAMGAPARELPAAASPFGALAGMKVRRHAKPRR